ncbi:hypothetical protein ABIA14_005127 [Sinorhizobium fredii]|uniref:hypothetical protein n=1 Tax=Rhizobium fredii TaxID=380 RepID=UPI0004B0CEC0|nr:Transcriptional regulator AraC family [Sinorhizobium fredii CCBAU 25509]
MIFLPLPFVVALLLVILLVATLRSDEPRKGLRPFAALICLCAVQSIIMGLRWGYDVAVLRYVLPVLASCLPPLVLASFRSLIYREAGASRARWLHAAPPLGIIALLVLAPALIDGALIVLFVGYALALLNLGRTGPDALDEARFDGVHAGTSRPSHRRRGALYFRPVRPRDFPRFPVEQGSQCRSDREQCKSSGLALSRPYRHRRCPRAAAAGSRFKH